MNGSLQYKSVWKAIKCDTLNVSLVIFCYILLQGNVCYELGQRESTGKNIEIAGYCR